MPKSIIFLMNGWDSSAGGIQTVNRELVSAVARARPELQCIVAVPKAAHVETEDAFSRGVTLVAGERAEDWANVLLSPKLRELEPADVVAVVGHSYFTGNQAVDLRNNLFPDALSIQFVHTSPLHVESVKEYKQDRYVKDREAKVAQELDIATRADLVICIGPRLHRAMHDLITARNKPGAAIKAINCGLSRPSESLRTPPLRPTLLCLGRTESLGVKGLDIFAYTAGYLSEKWMGHPSTRERPAPQFVVRGVQGDEEAFERRLISLAEEVGPRPTIIARPYTATREDLAADYRGATAFLMPSREEGFGLVACEALSYGVPALVSENSGIAEVIRQTALAHHIDVAHCVMSMAGDPKEVGRRFADAALDILVHEDRAASFCNMLSERLLPTCSWDAGALQFMAAIERALPDAPVNAGAARTQEPAPKPRHDAQSVLQAERGRLENLPGVITIGIQEAIVVTFERGRMPNDLPTELDGVPVVAMEGDHIRQTASPDGSGGDLIVKGLRTASFGLLTNGNTGEVYAITAAHAVDRSADGWIEVRLGSNSLPAHVVRTAPNLDCALLSIPRIKRAQAASSIGDANPGEAVHFTVSGTLVQGTITAVSMITSIMGADGRPMQFEDLFEVQTLGQVPPGASGALIMSVEGKALGMLVAGASEGKSVRSRIFAVPLRSIACALDVDLPEKGLRIGNSKVGIIPTDDVCLREILSQAEDVDRIVRDGRSYFRAYFDGRPRPVVVSPVPRAGNIGAAIAATTLIVDNDIGQIFLVGLCGGLQSGRQSLGDVVVCSDVIYYEPGIVGGAGDRQRFRISGSTPHFVLALVQDLERYPALPHVHIGSIASGEKLISGPSHFTETLSSWSNVIAVDMESAGVFEAAQSAGRNVSVAVVRGIADFADSDKIDSSQPMASRNAVAVALRLIALLPIRKAFDESPVSR